MHTYWEKLKQTIKKRFPFLEKLYIYIRNIPVLLSLSPQKRALQRRLSRIYRKHTRKIRIGFFVSENEKWASQTLFDKLKNHPYFEPILLLSSIEGLPPETAQEKFEKNRSFFQQICGEIVEVYNPQTNTYLPLEPYNLDIIFYKALNTCSALLYCATSRTDLMSAKKCYGFYFILFTNFYFAIM